jgi:spermidine synthase
VLVGGLGLGYTARAALASPRVAGVEVVEYLPEVIGWLERGLIPLAGELRDDARLRVVQGDVYARLTGPADTRFDLILIDVDHAPDDRLGDGNGAFYTAAGLARVSAHLAPGGVLGVWSADDSEPFAALLRDAFEAVRVERVTHLNEMVGEESTDWLFFGVRARSLH